MLLTMDGLAVWVDAGVAKLLRKNAAGVARLLVARADALPMVRSAGWRSRLRLRPARSGGRWLRARD